MNRRAFTLTALATSTQLIASTPRTRVAVIGHTGAGNYGHGIDTMWLTVPHCDIVAVADADEKGLAAALKKLNVTRGYADYAAMLAEQKPDIVAVGPRVLGEHHAMCMAAIQAGAKGIYMEKPFCRTLVEADEIIAACQQRGTQLALAHRNRYHPVLPVIQQLIVDGTIGRVLEYRARGKEDQRGGSLDLWVLGGHLFNLIAYFGGAPQSVSAIVLQNGKPATKADLIDGAEGTGPLAGNEVHARYELAGGAPAFFDSIHDAGVKSAGFGVQIIGTEGIIDLRTDEEPTAHLRKGSPYRPTDQAQPWLPITSAGIDKPESTPDIKTHVMGHGHSATDLIAAIRDHRPPLCSAIDGRVTLEMIMGVFESHRLNGARVELPLKERTHPFTRW
jgi:predicted dehydrogenase